VGFSSCKPADALVSTFVDVVPTSELRSPQQVL